MSAKSSIYHYYEIGEINHLRYPTTDQTLMNSKIYLIHQAELFLESLPEDRWINIRDIDPVIRKGVVEILTIGMIQKRSRNTGKYIYLRVVENDDWTMFKLTEGISSLRQGKWREV